MTKGKGFTLIELLIVIAIIAVLATVLVVTLNPTAQINKAKTATAESDLTSVVAPIQMDYNSNSYSYANACSTGAVTSLLAKYTTSHCNVNAGGDKWAVDLTDNGVNYCLDNTAGRVVTGQTATAGVCS